MAEHPEELAQGEQPQSVNSRPLFIAIGVAALVLIVGVGAWFFTMQGNGGPIAGGGRLGSGVS